MSVQILLQGRILGTEPFLLAGSGDDLDFAGREQCLSLLSEVLPRAILAELGLSKILLGSSGGEQFLIVLPQEARGRADEFFTAARADIRRLSGGTLNLLWAITENLGDWTVVRKRLNDEMQRKLDTPLAVGWLSAIDEVGNQETAYFEGLASILRDDALIGWSPAQPAHISTGAGKHSWSIGSSQDSVPLARHTALTDDGRESAKAPVLASRAEG